MKQILKLCLTLKSDAIFGSGASMPGGEDIALRTDTKGFPLIAGSTFKGLLRESVTDLIAWSGGDTALPTLLFGEEGRTGEDARRIIFSDLTLKDPPEDPEVCTSLRTFTQLENGVVKQGSLRVASCLHSGLVFTGLLLCSPEDSDLICQAVKGIKWAGLMRHRGFGRIQVSAAPAECTSARAAVKPAKLLRYRLKLRTPMSIPWLERSGAPGEVLNLSRTRLFLPGSAVRGMVCSRLAQKDPVWFEAHKSELLERVSFSDALPVLNGAASLPTPKGFYADKAGTRFYSVLKDGVVQPGDKRAPLGPFCTVDEGVLHTGRPSTVKAVRSARKSRDMFSVQRLEAGQELEGMICLTDAALAPTVAEAFGTYVWLGADRYAGSGLCEVEKLEAAQAPSWAALGYHPEDCIPDTLYMMAVSPLCMERDGLPCGLDEIQLAEALGVKEVTVERCATSLTESVGYNRTWGCAVPSVPMYESGSMFRLHCTPAPAAESLFRIQKEGIGLRRAEGCGQVLFWKDFEQVGSAPAGAASDMIGNTAADRLRRARCRWLLESRVPGKLSASQLGTIQAECERAIANGGSLDGLTALLSFNAEERGALHGDKFKEIQKCISQILETPLFETLTRNGNSQQLRRSDTENADSTIARLQLLCDWFDLSRKA